MKLSYIIAESIGDESLLTVKNELEELGVLSDIRITIHDDTRVLSFEAPDNMSHNTVLALGVMMGMGLILDACNREQKFAKL